MTGQYNCLRATALGSHSHRDTFRHLRHWIAGRRHIVGFLADDWTISLANRRPRLDRWPRLRGRDSRADFTTQGLTSTLIVGFH